MSFEGFNKVVKWATKQSNYRAEDAFVMNHWVMLSAKALRSKRDAVWRHTAVPRRSF